MNKIKLVFTWKKAYYFLVLVTVEMLGLQVVLWHYNITQVAAPFLSAMPMFFALICLCKMISAKDEYLNT